MIRFLWSVGRVVDFLRLLSQLQRELSSILSESESYRIDHYLGKELVMNVLVLRFANICFEVRYAP